MDYRHFTELLQQRLDRMPYDELLGFAVEICKRLFPDHASFHERHEWGDPDLLLDSITACEGAMDGAGDDQLINSLRSRVESMIPDTE